VRSKITQLNWSRAVYEHVEIPVSVKLSPFYSALPNLAQRLVEAGAQGLVLFNRFIQPDIDIEEMEVDPTLHLSTSAELLCLCAGWRSFMGAMKRTWR
jgi:dihydroorotate dehydrogenase (fumarate)